MQAKAAILALILCAVAATACNAGQPSRNEEVQTGTLSDANLADAADALLPEPDATHAELPDNNGCCKLADELAVLLPQAASDCGAVAVGQPAAPGYACAVANWQKNKPFHVTFQQAGVDSILWTTFVGTASTEFYILTSDSWQCAMPNYPDWANLASHIGISRCVNATAVQGFNTAWLTCDVQVPVGQGCGGLKQIGDAGSTDSSVLRVAFGGFNTVVPEVPVFWSELELQKSWGPCPPSTICSEKWRLEATGALVHVKDNNDTPIVQPNPDKLAQLHLILDGPDFLAAMQKGFDCPGVTDVIYTLRFDAAGTEFKKTVSGCVLTDPKSLPAQLKLLLEGP